MMLCSALCLRRARSELSTFGRVGKNYKSAHFRYSLTIAALLWTFHKPCE